MPVGRRPPFSGHLVLAHLTRSTVQPFLCRFELSSSHVTRPGHYQKLSTKTPSGIAEWQVVPFLSSTDHHRPLKISRSSVGRGEIKGISSDKAACRRRAQHPSPYRVATTPDKKATLPYHHRLLRYLPRGSDETSYPLSKKPGRHRTKPRVRPDVTTARGRSFFCILGALFLLSLLKITFFFRSLPLSWNQVLATSGTNRPSQARGTPTASCRPPHNLV